MTKKTLVILTVIALFLNVSPIAFTDDLSTNKYISVTLNVSEIFGFKLESDDEFSQVLDLTNQDATDDYGSLHMLVTSNKNSEWWLRASSGGVSNAQTGYGVPLVMSTTGKGTTVTNVELVGRPRPIYRCAKDEYVCKDLLVPATFTVKDGVLPAMAGTYEGSIYIDMVGDIAQ
ncbi:MAG: hypothetical protein JW800_04995 [Candidatus Omnitrophica bacterium]|nr:hypothetical protein [Candidatus Omnitrophota bacterium]